jgi:hypothetical protein
LNSISVNVRYPRNHDVRGRRYCHVMSTNCQENVFNETQIVAKLTQKVKPIDKLLAK